MQRYLFVSLYIISILILTERLTRTTLADASSWASHSGYFQTGDPREYDEVEIPAHPGGPLIEADILLHDTTGVSYDDALTIFMILFSGVVIAGSAMLAYVLRKDMLWSIAIVGILSLNPLVVESTPPSLLVAYASVLLCMLTLYIYERKDTVSLRALAFWSIVAGCTAAIRADVGGIEVVIFAALLSTVYGVKKSALLLIGAFASFIIFDPFMWLSPVQHLEHLISKMLYHYNQMPSTTYEGMSISQVVSISACALLSMGLAIVYVTFRKKLLSPLPIRFLLFLIAMTGIIYSIYLSAQYKISRYFAPPIFIWEVLFPLLAFSLIACVRFPSLPEGPRAMRLRHVLRITLVAVLLIPSIVAFIRIFQ